MKIFIRGLPTKYTQDKLKNHFKKYNPVISSVFNITDGTKCGTLEFKEESIALKAISEMNGTDLEGCRISVTEHKERPKNVQSFTPGDKPKPQKQPFNHSFKTYTTPFKSGFQQGQEKAKSTSAQKSGETFPYRFSKRPIPDAHLAPPRHDRLDGNRFDIAFDIEWTTLTPTAANPCEDPETPESNPPGEDGYQGYNRTWLMMDGKLAISPFTVKSAVANAVANLLGGCIRVQSNVVPHSNEAKGDKYHYIGNYKRYRVNMGGTSKPGYLTNIQDVPGGKRVTIQPAQEYFLDRELPKHLSNLKPGEKVFATIRERGYKPSLILKLSDMNGQGATFTDVENPLKLTYHGPYGYGVDLIQDGKNHRHRFYRAKQGEEGRLQTGIIPAINFAASSEEMEQVVHMGQFRDDPIHYPGKTWFQSLHDIKGGDPGDWVYYETFNGQVTNIGRSFLFKALFLHEDTVPDGQRACTDMNALCPRCAMFGMTDETKEADRPAVGYGGRFKSAALVNDIVLHQKPLEETPETSIPYLSGRDHYTKVKLKEWVAGGQTLCRQVFLPIQGPPKPNKRDISGYFNPKTGSLKGVKTYRHSGLNLNALDDRIKKIIPSPETVLTDKREFQYAHKMRNYAQVCREHLTFSGTVGLEAASDEEIAALVLCLDSRLAHHGYKIGLGKSFGLGSVSSRITRIYLRKPDTYEWSAADVPLSDSLTVETMIKVLKKAGLPLEWAVAPAMLEDAQTFLNAMDDMDHRKLEFPKVKGYWETARKTGFE